MVVRNMVSACPRGSGRTSAGRDRSLTIPAIHSPLQWAHGSAVTVPRVVLVAFESAQILDVTGPLEVFSTASRFVPGVNYDISVAGVGGGMLASSSGLSFSTVDLSDCRTPPSIREGKA